MHINVIDRQGVHHRLMHLAAWQVQSDYRQCSWLLAGLRCGVHRELGFASFAEYGERLFGYPRREVTERVRVGRALERDSVSHKQNKQQQHSTRALAINPERSVTPC